MHDLAFVFAGFLADMVVGVGNGSLTMPVLIKPYLAAGTDLLFAVLTKMGAALPLTAAATLHKAVRGKSVPKVLAHGKETAANIARHWSLPLLLGTVICSLVTLPPVNGGVLGVSILPMPFPLRPI